MNNPPCKEIMDVPAEVPRLFTVAVLGGAAAGVSVDIVLYPLDTLKTRLQSQYGFWNSGGFKGVYKGIGPTSIGSPISAGIFFGVYDCIKSTLTCKVSETWNPCIHMFSASVAEVTCCTTKVPMEILKQRRQASSKNLSTIKILITALKQEGILGMYRGFSSTVIRDVPFSLIEFPMWEWLQKKWKHKVKRNLTTSEVAMCGAVAGGIAATLTTPLDVVKTQIMLTDNVSDPKANTGIFSSIFSIYQKQGISKLFSGFLPRISLIMVGGSIFFGAYDKCCTLIEENVIKTLV